MHIRHFAGGYDLRIPKLCFRVSVSRRLYGYGGSSFFDVYSNIMNKKDRSICGWYLVLCIKQLHVDMGPCYS